MKILFLLYFISLNAFAHLSCKQTSTKVMPFYVTGASGQGEKSYENFRSKSNYRKKKRFIPRRSIVKIPNDVLDYVGHPRTYIPVEVIGTPSDYADRELLKSKNGLKKLSGFKSGLRKVKKGDKGFIYADSIKRAKDFHYVLTEDSPFLEKLDLGQKKNVVLKLKRNLEGEYLINRCCEDNGQCQNYSLFDVIYQDEKQEKMLALNINQCMDLDSLIPLESSNFDSFMDFIRLSSQDEKVNFSLKRIEVLDERGVVKVPLDKETMEGPFGSYHYGTDDNAASDVYIKPTAGCAFMEVLKKQQEVCVDEGCEIQFGNMFHKVSWGVHATHESGACIDIRPLKKRSSRLALDYESSEYDMAKTRDFIELLQSAGGSPIYFNDPDILNRNSGVHYSDGHHNHIHVCFHPENEKVQKTCKLGL